METDGEWSLEQVEGADWGDPPPEARPVVARVHRLRRKPIGQLTANDLRVLVAQRVGLAALLPRVLDRLAENPLVEADFFPGDLLTVVLRVPAEHWRAHPDQHARIERIITAVADPDPELTDEITAFRART